MEKMVSLVGKDGKLILGEDDTPTLAEDGKPFIVEDGSPILVKDGKLVLPIYGEDSRHFCERWQACCWGR